MLRVPGVIKKLGIGVVIGGSLAISAGTAQAVTPFQQDVTTAIDRGIEWLANSGAFNNPSSAGDASGLPMQALLEKRASGNPADPPQGYAGSNATDQARLRTAAAYILDRVNETAFYAYRDGQWMFALASYALTGGPDKSVLAPANPDYQTIKEAMDSLVTRTLANQSAAGYWCYTNSGCEDSSTTQFAAAGLHAAKTFYLSPNSGDQLYADPAKAAAIDAALVKTKDTYASVTATTGSDNASCNVLTATERGHGYNSFRNTGYKPSLQQTASGIYIQLFGGSNVNTAGVQQYMEWVRNRYRYTDLDNLGNFWPNESWSYYLWSSFKAMELIRQAGIAPNPGNLGPNAFGTLPAASAPACIVRQENKDPATVARPASFGPGGVGFYAGETKGQYFDYATEIIAHQCYDGSLPINGNDGRFVCGGPSPWEAYSHQSYQLLVLQRSTGTVVTKCDIDGDGDVDINDVALIRAGIGQPPAASDPRDANSDGRITINDVRACTLLCTRASCSTN